MAQRYFLQCSFKGTSFNGWQKQDNAPSVQEAIEKGLYTLLRCKVDILGAGRTDTGVHAKNYIAHFDVEEPIGNMVDFLYKLNKVVPYDIAFQQIVTVSAHAHARFDALSRTYNYQIIAAKDPFEKEFCWLIGYALNVDAMQQACNVLKEYTDFTSFCKLHSDNKTNICHIQEAYWHSEKEKLVFTIKADRFLRNMVRAIVGTMIEIGRNKISIEDFRKIIESKNRNKAGTSAPAHGLFFVGAEYPKSIFCGEASSSELLQ